MTKSSVRGRQRHPEGWMESFLRVNFSFFFSIFIAQNVAAFCPNLKTPEYASISSIHLTMASAVSKVRDLDDITLLLGVGFIAV